MRKDQADIVVVGIDGSATAGAALEWAAAEAERRGVPLVIAHAGHLAQSGALDEDTARSALREVSAFGKTLLSDAVATAVETHRLVDVRAELREMDPAKMLIELSETASVLVVGRGDDGSIARFIFGSTAQRVAEHARCPVVVVGPDTSMLSARTIVVGISDSSGGQQAAQFACSEALAREAKVVGIRSWTELNWARLGFPFPPGVSFKSLQAGEEALLDECIRAAREAYPGVGIEGVITEQPAYEALENAGRQADLLVIGCRRDEGGHLPRLGPIASWLLRHSPCPVAIVGHATAVADEEETALAPSRPLDDPAFQPAGS